MRSKRRDRGPNQRIACAATASEVWQQLAGDPGASGIAKEAELNCEAQTVLVATTFGDQIQVPRGERVACGDLPGIGRQHQELSGLSGREDFLSRHGCSCGIGDCTVWL